MYHDFCLFLCLQIVETFSGSPAYRATNIAGMNQPLGTREYRPLGRAPTFVLVVFPSLAGASSYVCTRGISIARWGELLQAGYYVCARGNSFARWGPELLQAGSYVCARGIPSLAGASSYRRAPTSMHGIAATYGLFGEYPGYINRVEFAQAPAILEALTRKAG